MTLLFRWQGQTTQGVTDPALPGTTGYDDVGSATDGEHSVAYDNIRFGTHAMSGRTVPMVRFVDSALGGAPHWEIIPGAEPDKATPPTFAGAYSLRFYYRQSSAASTTTQPIMRFLNGTTTQYGLSSVEQTRPAFDGLTGGVAAMSPATGMFRFELQVDPERSPKAVLRIYVEDETGTVHRSLTANPADTTIDRIRIGHYISGNYVASEVQYADIEFHDDYDLGGQFTSNPSSPTAASTTATGAASTTPTVASTYNYDATTNRTLPAATLTVDTHYTAHLDIDYTTAGTFGRKLDLYVPTGDAPTDGWPVVVWAHPSSFTGGTKTDLPSAWRDDLLNAGYAVATVQYVRSSLDAVAPYDSYGATAEFRGGRYPSHIVDYKRAAAWLRDQTTYNLDGSRMFATGASAGGYLALGAAITRDLAADGEDTPLSLAACTTAGNPWSDGYTDVDPEFLGCFVYAPPVDMDLVVSWDPTFPDAGGALNVTHRAFQGLIITGTAAPSHPHSGLSGLVGLNAENLCPIAYVRGTADYVIHWEHQAALAAAMVAHDASIPAAAAGPKYVEYTTPNNHDRAHLIYDDSTIIGWLDNLLAASYPSASTSKVRVADAWVAADDKVRVADAWVAVS